jgi:hypothetical protein
MGDSLSGHGKVRRGDLELNVDPETWGILVLLKEFETEGMSHGTYAGGDTDCSLLHSKNKPPRGVSKLAGFPPRMMVSSDSKADWTATLSRDRQREESATDEASVGKAIGALSRQSWRSGVPSVHATRRT